MREALDAHADYHRGLEPKFNKLSIDDLDSHSDLPFSSLSDIATVIDQLTAEMTGVTQKDQKMEHKVLEVQSRMVKSESNYRVGGECRKSRLTSTSGHEGQAGREADRGSRRCQSGLSFR